ncbi:ABC transporter ATP-binding protein [Desnuesiella massiliensis]|uniref:ABC transporter ATP-binding protein n=1 Tax=Desnuesiella massiliensis TaxID=1650662 RepID=UPI0006E136D0|nr:ABC transporter ATP-binding protein [Desnuesiella massiliensis]
MKEIVLAKDIIKIYGYKSKGKALDGVSLTVYEGDYICIMGPSGSGKSTLLNVLSTIDMPTKGVVEIDKVNILKINEFDLGRFRYERLGFIFQEFNLIDSLTIRENIGVPLALADKAESEINKKVENMAEKLSISEILDKFPVECSGGESQRAAAARALITEPKMIVADEPTGNLDTKNSHELLKLLKELNEKEGITIIMVTHDSMIASYAKKLLFLRDGKIDETIERGDLTQKEFFYKIVEITSKESQNLFESIIK